MNLKVPLENKLIDVESKAKMRDLKNAINLDEIARQEKIANEKGFGLYKIKDTNKTPFVQVMDENINVLVSKEYVTTAELAFLLSLTPYLAMGSNAVKNHQDDSFLNISQIADELKKTRKTVGTIIQSLIDKGIMFEIVNGRELKRHQRSVTARPLFVNPEILYRGNRNFVDPTLCDLVMEFDVLEKNKILFPFKVWHEHQEEFGKLYARKTYLTFKNKQKSRGG